MDDPFDTPLSHPPQVSRDPRKSPKTSRVQESGLFDSSFSGEKSKVSSKSYNLPKGMKMKPKPTGLANVNHMARLNANMLTKQVDIDIGRLGKNFWSRRFLAEEPKNSKVVPQTNFFPFRKTASENPTPPTSPKSVPKPKWSKPHSPPSHPKNRSKSKSKPQSPEQIKDAICANLFAKKFPNV